MKSVFKQAGGGQIRKGKLPFGMEPSTSPESKTPIGGARQIDRPWL